MDHGLDGNDHERQRPIGPFWSFVLALVLAPPLMFAFYLELASAIDRAYRSAQSIPPAIGPVIGYSLLGVLGPAVAGLVLAGLLRSRRILVAATYGALCAEAIGLAVGLLAGFSMLHAGVT